MQTVARSRLCAACAKVKLLPQKLALEEQTSGAAQAPVWSRERYYPFNCRYELGALAAVYRRRSTCALCCLVAKILDTHFAPDYLEKLRGNSRRGPYVCDLVRKEFCQLYRGQDSTSIVGRLYDTSIEILCYNSDERDERVYSTGVGHALQPSLPSGTLTLSQTEDVYYGRRRGPRINPQLLRDWLDKCENAHHTGCRLSGRNALPESFRLIDVEYRCVVSTSGLVTNGFDVFVALSYVWGENTQSLLLTSANENSLVRERPGGSTFELENLPKTVADAITLVRMLGIRYLWVDALCIVQDSDHDKQVQISSMGKIYQNAALTIVAACAEDATSSLPGVSTPRQGSQEHVSAKWHVDEYLLGGPSRTHSGWPGQI
jgi:Heterokaryon incompatibility protein (HET)